MKQTRADRDCVICPNRFTPMKDEQRACGFKCARTLAGRTLKAKGTPGPLAVQHRVNAARRLDRITRACADRFGALTTREVEIFGFAAADGYNRGYTRGYTARKRSGSGSKKAGAA